MDNKTKVLFFDIENTPILGHAWGMYEQNLLTVVKDNELLSFAWCWNDGKIFVMSRRLFSERQLAKFLWKLFDEADVIIGHNGDSFDIKMANQYFLKHGLTAPSPYKSVDTKKIAKRYFRFAQNKLDYLAQFMFKEKKISTNLDLWLRCMAGESKAFLEMEKYNIHDVVLLRKVYDKLKGWHTGHPNTNLYSGTSHQCPVCSGNTQRRGLAYTRTAQYQRYQCVGECKGWSTGERVPLPAKVIK